MKKSIYYAGMFLIMFVTLPVGAQIRFGIVSGFNFSSFTSSGEKAIDGHTDWGIGGVLDLHLWKGFSVSIEPTYLKIGGTIEEVAPEPAYAFDTSCLEIPIFVKYSFGKTLRPYLFAGSTIGYLLTSDLAFNMGGIGFRGDFKDVLNTWIFGYGFGAGISYPLWKGSIFIEGRYVFRVSNLMKGGSFNVEADPLVIELDIEEGEELKNRGFQIMGGVTLPLGW